MIQGVLNDRNNIFLHMYYALLFLGSSNIFFEDNETNLSSKVRSTHIIGWVDSWDLLNAWAFGMIKDYIYVRNIWQKAWDNGVVTYVSR